MDIPNYTVYRGKRKTILVVLKPNGTLAVYCPLRTANRVIEETVRKLYPSMKVKHAARGDVLFKNGSSLPYLGQNLPIHYNNGAKKIVYDGTGLICPKTDRETLRRLYREFLKRETKQILPVIVREVADKFGFKYGTVSIRSTYSRFGSCTANGNLNFSLALAALDCDFIYSVVCHELCHTVHHNHSEKFHALLNFVCPQHDSLHQEHREEYSALLRSIFFNPAF